MSHTLEEHHIAKLQAALTAMEFTDTDQAIEWLLRYSIHGATHYCEAIIAKKLLNVVHSHDEEYNKVELALVSHCEMLDAVEKFYANKEGE